MDRVEHQEAAADPVAEVLEEEDLAVEDPAAEAEPEALEGDPAAEEEEIREVQGPGKESSRRRHGPPRQGLESWSTRARLPTSTRP